MQPESFDRPLHFISHDAQGEIIRVSPVLLFEDRLTCTYFFLILLVNQNNINYGTYF